VLKLSLRSEYFNAIKAGTKTVEGRLNTAKFKDLKPGMPICFVLPETGEELYCNVQAINIYPSWLDMLQSEGLQNMLPGIDSLQSGVKLYESFPGYQEGVSELGALAIRIMLLSY